MAERTKLMTAVPRGPEWSRRLALAEVLGPPVSMRRRGGARPRPAARPKPPRDPER